MTRVCTVYYATGTKGEFDFGICSNIISIPSVSNHALQKTRRIQNTHYISFHSSLPFCKDDKTKRKLKLRELSRVE